MKTVLTKLRVAYLSEHLLTNLYSILTKVYLFRLSKLFFREKKVLVAAAFIMTVKNFKRMLGR